MILDRAASFGVSHCKPRASGDDPIYASGELWAKM